MDCRTHSGQHNEDERARYDSKMKDLPNNQSGEGRHKCPYCAYLKGRKEGRKEGREDVLSEIRKLVKTFEQGSLST